MQNESAVGVSAGLQFPNQICEVYFQCTVTDTTSSTCGLVAAQPDRAEFYTQKLCNRFFRENFVHLLKTVYKSPTQMFLS